MTVVLSRSVVSNSLWPHGLARQAPLSMRLSRQEHWSGFPCCPPRYLPNPQIDPTFPESPVLADRFFTSATWEDPENKQCEANKHMATHIIYIFFLKAISVVFSSWNTLSPCGHIA